MPLHPRCRKETLIPRAIFFSIYGIIIIIAPIVLIVDSCRYFLFSTCANKENEIKRFVIDSTEPIERGSSHCTGSPERICVAIVQRSRFVSISGLLRINTG